jgi:iron complex transport system ATP-binding protein
MKTTITLKLISILFMLCTLSACGRFGQRSASQGEQRIVCIGQAYNEMIYALGAQANLVGVLSQAIEVAFPIPVRELVMMGRYPHFQGRPSSIDEQICDEVMDYFDVCDLAGRSYGTLSGGEKQRVNFARVLAQIWRPIAGSARYLFLDEPLTFLDIHHQVDFMVKIRTFAEQLDVVVVGVVHDLNLAAKFAGRFLLLHRGRVLADGGPAEVLTAEHLRTAFDVTPVLLTNPATGEIHLAFD